MINASLRIVIGMPLAAALVALFVVALLVEWLAGLARTCPTPEDFR